MAAGGARSGGGLMDAVFLKLMALYCRQWFLPEERGSILILFLADLSASRGSVHLSLVFVRWYESPREQWKRPPFHQQGLQHLCRESPSLALVSKASEVLPGHHNDGMDHLRGKVGNLAAVPSGRNARPT